ncbi:MAG: hypothetical protein ABIP94_24085 [Planctomycetota bacterium]
MASRTPSRSRSSGRSAKSSSSNSQPLIFGGIGLAVVIALVVMMNRKGPDTGDATPGAKNTPAASKPVAAPVPLAGAKAGKNPTRPAPPLTPETLAEIRSSRVLAEGLYNEGVTARNAGDNSKARDKQAQAKDALEKVETLLADSLRWQEEAQMEGWAQPAEYMTLEKEYGAVMKLTKRIRMGGGK